jgi:hypothetical protein
LLVGGNSTRFGSPKTHAVVDGETLADRFLPPVEIAVVDLTAVETNFGMTGGIRIRLAGPDDGTVF